MNKTLFRNRQTHHPQKPFECAPKRFDTQVVEAFTDLYACRLFQKKIWMHAEQKVMEVDASLSLHAQSFQKHGPRINFGTN